jgi:hypothetical protein
VIVALRGRSGPGRCEPPAVAERQYRLVVAGELSGPVEHAFEGMRLERDAGNTVLVGPVRDQASLQGLLQRVSDLGLTLLSATAIEDDPVQARSGA